MKIGNVNEAINAYESSFVTRLDALFFNFLKILYR